MLLEWVQQYITFFSGSFFPSSWPQPSSTAPVTMFPLITTATPYSFCFCSSAPCCCFFLKPLTFLYSPLLSFFSPWIDPSSTVSLFLGVCSALTSPPIKSWFECSPLVALMDVGMFFICQKNSCFMRRGWVFFSSHRCAGLGSLYLFLPE